MKNETTFQIGDLVRYNPYGYIAIVLEIAFGNASTKIKPLDYRCYDDYLWVPTPYLELVS